MDPDPAPSPEPELPEPPAPPSLVEAEAFVALLARELHRYGSPAHRLEEAMRNVASKLGLDGEFFCTPTAIFASFRPAAAARRDEPPHTVLLRLEPGEVNLEKLSQLDSILLRVLHGKLAVTVSDTGVGFGKAATAGTGVGLANIRERLQLLYGNKATLNVRENPDGGTAVTVTVPYKSIEGADA